MRSEDRGGAFYLPACGKIPAGGKNIGDNHNSLKVYAGASPIWAGRAREAPLARQSGFLSFASLSHTGQSVQNADSAVQNVSLKRAQTHKHVTYTYNFHNIKHVIRRTLNHAPRQAHSTHMQYEGFSPLRGVDRRGIHLMHELAANTQWGRIDHRIFYN